MHGPGMRILELHAPYFREHWRREHEVIAWGPHAHCDLVATRPVVRLTEILELLPEGWHPDLILFGDDSHPLRVLGLEDAPCPLAMLSIDAHHHAAWHAPLATAFDSVFVAQRDHLPAFRAAGVTVARWLPLWAPDDLPRPRLRKTHQVSFVGSLDTRFHPERVAFLDAIRPQLPLHVAEGDYRPIFTRSRIVLNQTVKGDLNGRVFEAMACGAMLLTERTGNGLLDLFTEGSELVTYPRGDVDGVVAIAGRLLASDRERRRIAAAGSARVRAQHCATHRAATVLGHVAGGRHRLASGPRHAAVARAYCVLADWVRRYAEAAPESAAQSETLREAYLAEAARLALDATVGEPDRSAIVGLVALERGELKRAQAQLAWVVQNGGGVTERLAYIDALVRGGSLGAALEAAEALCARHPDHVEGGAVLAALVRATAA
jgi:hypothetical protein